MAHQLDEISMHLGEIRAELKALAARDKDHAIKIDIRLAALENKVAADSAELIALKNRGWGFLIGLALVSATAGSWLATQGKAFLSLLVKG